MLKSLLRSIALMAGYALMPSAMAIDYPDFSDPTGLQLNGVAAVNGAGELVMTPPQTNVTSSVFTFGGVDSSAFSTAFSFLVKRPDGATTDCDGQVGGEGLTFVLQATEPTAIGEGGAGIGYSGIPASFGVEFDTYCNPDRNDPNTNHIGLVALGSNVHTSLPTVNIPTRFDNGKTQYVWIDYDGTTIEVRINTRPRRPNNPVLSHVINIRALLGGRLCCAGFTSATSDNVGSHRVQQWQLSSDDDDDDDDDRSAPWSQTVNGPVTDVAPRPVCRNRVGNRPIGELGGAARSR